ncbi:hypothetical protein [Pseudomonas sp.]|uniref:hypothetical protein n=1 Tax=Pseudomonas sp. TaxID=306 RepID=UPI003FD712D4
MEESIVMIMLALIFAGGIFTGNICGTNDVSQKVITQAIKACENSEGLYKINKGSGRDSTKAFCKNNDRFDLKDEK